MTSSPVRKKRGRPTKEDTAGDPAPTEPVPPKPKRTKEDTALRTLKHNFYPGDARSQIKYPADLYEAVRTKAFEERTTLQYLIVRAMYQAYLPDSPHNK